jgi:hypothetical protein
MTTERTPENRPEGSPIDVYRQDLQHWARTWGITPTELTRALEKVQAALKKKSAAA